MSFKPYAQQNIEVFWDTIRMINTNKKLHDSVFNTISKSEVYSHTSAIPQYTKNRFEDKAEYITSNKRTFQAAIDSYDSRYKTAVLNFANAFTPGGGILGGSGAQEESLCRCSTLYPCLNFDEAFEKYYGYNNKKRNRLDVLGSNGVIYSPDIHIIKSDTSTPERLPENQWINVDIITCAAPHLFYDYINKDYINVMSYRIRKILSIAASNKVDNLILGAFGCGAFNNPPVTVAKIFKEELQDFNHAFKRVEFAIMGFDDNPNYNTFKDVLA